MKQITSIQNPSIKKIRQLIGSGKFRYQYRQTILEGVHLCQSFLESGGAPVLCLFSESSVNNPEVQKIIDECRRQEVELLSASTQVFSSISTVENGIGLLMLMNIPTPNPVQRLDASAILLDRVQDPGNAGTILRTTAAAGIHHVFMSLGSVDPWSPKALRAGMGAHFHLAIHQHVNLEEFISGSAIPVLATSLFAKQSIYDADLSQNVAWLMGNEGQGVEQSLLDLPNVETVIIPQSPEVESLNVAAATAVCLFEHRRQRSQRQ